MNLKGRVKRPWLVIAISLCLFSAFAVVTAIHSVVRGCACTDAADSILNNLRQIEAAKSEWVLEHTNAKVGDFTEQELDPYVQAGAWKGIAGEIYILHGTNQPPEALMTRDVDWVPKGMKLRFTDGKVEVRTNTAVSGPAGK